MAVCNNPPELIVATFSEVEEGRRWEAPAPLRLWHVASLDAPTVAAVWSCGFAWAAHLRVPMWAPAVLALIAWAVYIGDRLLDAWAGMQSPPLHEMRERHHFHWRYRRFLGPAALAAAAAAAAFVAMRLPARARMPDTALAAATLFYFSGVHSRGRLRIRGRIRSLSRLLSAFSSRALWIGVLFTAGCLLPAASQISAGTSAPVARLLAFPALFFAALGWLNCYAIGRWESASRRAAGNGIAAKAGLVAGAGTVMVLLTGATSPRAAWLMAAGVTSALLLAALEHMRERMTPVALRAAADLVLLTPVFLLMLGR